FLLHGQRRLAQPGTRAFPGAHFCALEFAAGDTARHDGGRRDCNSRQSRHRVRRSRPMKMQTAPLRSPTMAGQRAIGIGITLALIAIVSVLPLLPWHFLAPVISFVSERPLLNALFS